MGTAAILALLLSSSTNAGVNGPAPEKRQEVADLNSTDPRVSQPGLNYVVEHNLTTVFVDVQVGESAPKWGIDVNALRNQVELALRNCGFTPGSPKATGLRTGVFLNVWNFSGSPSDAFGKIDLLVHTLVPVDGYWVQAHVAYGAYPFRADSERVSGSIREATAVLLDRFCNLHLQVRDAVKARSAPSKR